MMDVNDFRRLTATEFKIEDLEKKYDLVQDALKKLAEGINTLVHAEIRREADIATFNRLGTTMHELSLRLDIFEKRIDSMQETRVRSELNTYKSLVWRAINWTVTASGALAVAYVTWHFGWRPQ